MVPPVAVWRGQRHIISERKWINSTEEDSRMTILNAPKPASIACQSLRFFAGILAVMLAILVVSGCASISPAPFTALTTSTQQLRDSADAALSMVHERTRNRYVAEAASGDSAKIEALLLTQPAGETF